MADMGQADLLLRKLGRSCGGHKLTSRYLLGRTVELAQCSSIKRQVNRLFLSAEFVLPAWVRLRLPVVSFRLVATRARPHRLYRQPSSRLELTMIKLSQSRGPMLALASSTLFGASTPFAKMLVGDVQPALLAAILYLGSGIGLLLVRSARGFLQMTSSDANEHFGMAGAFWLAAAILVGGVIGPLLLMFGLTMTPCGIRIAPPQHGGGFHGVACLVRVPRELR